MKKLLENWQKYLTEKTFDDSKFPFPQVASAEEAEQVFTGGLKDGDPYDDVVKIKVSPNIAPCKDVYPTQSEIILTNSLEVALRIELGKLPSGCDIGAIFSKENYIMDGHHRWAGNWLNSGGDTVIGGVKVDMPAEQLVAVLAAVGDKFHPGKRNPGRAEENIFNVGLEKVNEIIDALTTQEGYSRWLTPDDAKRACESLAGSIEDAKELLTERLQEIKKNTPPSWAPKREEMPVLSYSKGEAGKAASAIEKGQVDIYEPYALEESTELPKEIFNAFEDEIAKSNFWMEENDYDDLDDEIVDTPPETPATMALTLAMNKALKKAGMEDVVALAHSSGNFANDPWTSATIDVSKDGRPVFMILMNLWEDYEDFGIPVEKMIKDVSAALRHELVHLQQLKAQAKSKGIDLEAAFQKMMDDPKQVADRDDPKYWEIFEPTGKKDSEGKEIIHKDGFKSNLFMKDYLEKHIEVDGHAHQAAENLLDQYGEEEALDVISKDIDLDDPALPGEVKKYKNYDVDKKKMNKFRSKIYTYIKKFTEEM